MSKTSAEPSLDQMAVEIVEALEPKPTRRPDTGYGSSPGKLWQWDDPTVGWVHVPLHGLTLISKDFASSVEALLRQDPEKWESYGWELEVEVLGPETAYGTQPVQSYQVADIATASVEQRLRAAYRAVRGE